MEGRELKPQVKILLIIILIILGAIVIENVINLFFNVTEEIKTKHEIKKEQEIYMSTPEYAEEQKIEACVKTAIEYLSSGDYEALYNVIDPDYKEYMQIDSVDKFKEVLATYMNGADSVKLLDYGKQNDRYLCDVIFTSGDNVFSKRLLVKQLENEEFYIILDDIYNIEKFNGRFRVFDDTIDYNLVYRVNRGSTNTYVMDVTNYTNKDMVGSYKNTYLMKTDRKTYEPQNKEELENITIPAGGTVRVYFTISNGSVNSYTFPDDMLYLNFDFADGTRRSDNMILQWEYWE
ncbi:MAG: hypothetical protein IJX99_03650 [Clostridia bacterium]|nr:hypothetical protein [Clostridia bacterium]